MTLTLSKDTPFARGGNRLCFVHPEDPYRVIKVRRPDVSLAFKRSKKGFPKNLRPLSSFDDNAEENRVMQSLDKQYGEELYKHVSKCYGFYETDMGPGLVSDLIRDENEKVSHTLKQVIWDNGFDDTCQKAVADFAHRWIELAIPSRDLLLHNIVVQKDLSGNIQRLVVIDGLGSPNIIPRALLPLKTRQNKAKKKVDNMYSRIDTLLGQRGAETFPGYHGLLIHDGDIDNESNTESKKP